MTNTKPQDQTITWTDGFRPFRAVIKDGIISEYARDTLVAQWSAERTENLDGDPGRDYYDLGSDTDCAEYSCGPVGQLTVAWIDGAAYQLTDTEIGAAIDVDVNEID